MARPRKSEQKDLRTAAIRAGLELLQNFGRDAVTMSAVADIAQCRAPALYRYFDGKERLLAALQHWGFDTLTRQQEAEVATSPSLADQLEGFARAHIGFAGRHPALYDLMVHGPAPRLPAMALKGTVAPCDDCFAMIRQAFLAHRADCVWPGSQAETAAFAFWVMMQGAVSLALRDQAVAAPCLKEAEKTIQLAIRLFAAPAAAQVAA